MKYFLRIASLILALIALSVNLVSAKAGGSLTGWTVVGSIITVKNGGGLGPGAAYGNWHVEGLGSGGTISQSLPVLSGAYVFAVWCDGNGIFTIAQSDWSLSQRCDATKSWGSLTFIPSNNLVAGNVNISAQLANGDGADQFCLYPLFGSDGGHCPPSAINNFSFENRW